MISILNIKDTAPLSSFSVVYLNLPFLNRSLAIVSLLEIMFTWQPPTVLQFSQHWCMSVYVCILMLRPRVHSGHVLKSVGLPYCTLGSQRAGDGVSWVGIWKSWLLVQADCGQPWVQTWAHLFYRQKAGATPIPATLWGPRTAAPTRCLFLSTFRD